MSTMPPLTLEAAKQVYAGEYYSSAHAARFKLPVAETVMRLFRQRRARVLSRRLAGVAGKRILDVGCGRGMTLRALGRRGADVYGTQLSPSAARAAERLIGAGRVFVGELRGAGLPAASFDAVTLWHVLEHVVDPVETLTEVARLLKPNGLVYVEVPNAGGWTARTFGRDWLAWDVEHHAWHFTPPTLEAVASRAGLRPAGSAYLSLEYSPVTLMQTWLNRLLGGDNALFRAVKEFRSTDQPFPRAVVVGHAIAGAVLLAPACVATLLLGACRASDTFGTYLQHR
jgi:SAM-dependent methyltransferase